MKRKYVLQITTTSDELEFITGDSAVRLFTTDDRKFYFWNEDTNEWQLETIPGGGGGSGTAHLSFDSGDFEPDGVTLLHPDLTSGNISVFFSDIGNFLYSTKGHFQFVTGGIEFLLEDFKANKNNYNIEVFLKTTS